MQCSVITGIVRLLVIVCLHTDRRVSFESFSSKVSNTHLLGVDVHTTAEHRAVDVFFCK